MAMSSNDAFATRRPSRPSSRPPLARGPVRDQRHPLVDVMLVLLIIFMISAPLLTAGVPLELPKTEAAALQNQQEPITVSIRKDGHIFVGERDRSRSRTWRRASAPSPATATTSRSSSAPTARRPTRSSPRPWRPCRTPASPRST
jgi:hypothetical protein